MTSLVDLVAAENGEDGGIDAAALFDTSSGMTFGVITHMLRCLTMDIRKFSKPVYNRIWIKYTYRVVQKSDTQF